MTVTCRVCRTPLNDRADVRYQMGADTLCSPTCILIRREEVGAW